MDGDDVIILSSDDEAPRCAEAATNSDDDDDVICCGFFPKAEQRIVSQLNVGSSDFAGKGCSHPKKNIKEEVVSNVSEDVAPKARSSYAENLKRFEALIPPQKPKVLDWTESDEAAIDLVRASLEAAFTGERTWNDAMGSVLDISNKLTFDLAPSSVRVSDLVDCGYGDVEFVKTMEFPEEDAYFYYLAKVSSARKHKKICKKKKKEIKERKAREKLKAKSKSRHDSKSKKKDDSRKASLECGTSSSSSTPSIINKNELKDRKHEHKDKTSKGSTRHIEEDDNSMDEEHVKPRDRERMFETQRYEKYRRARDERRKKNVDYSFSSGSVGSTGPSTSSISSSADVISDMSDRSRRNTRISFGDVVCKVFSSDAKICERPVRVPPKSPLRSVLKGSRLSSKADTLFQVDSPTPSISPTVAPTKTTTKFVDEILLSSDDSFGAAETAKTNEPRVKAKEPRERSAEPEKKRWLSIEEQRKRKAPEGVAENSMNLVRIPSKRPVSTLLVPVTQSSAMSSKTTPATGGEFSPRATAMKLQTSARVRIGSKQIAEALSKESKKPPPTVAAPRPSAFPPLSSRPALSSAATALKESIPPPALVIRPSLLDVPKNCEYTPINRHTLLENTKIRQGAPVNGDVQDSRIVMPQAPTASSANMFPPPVPCAPVPIKRTSDVGEPQTSNRPTNRPTLLQTPGVLPLPPVRDIAQSSSPFGIIRKSVQDLNLSALRVSKNIKDKKFEPNKHHITAKSQRDRNNKPDYSHEEISCIEDKTYRTWSDIKVDNVDYPFNPTAGVFWPLFQPSDRIDISSHRMVESCDVFNQMGCNDAYNFAIQNKLNCSTRPNRMRENFLKAKMMSREKRKEVGRFNNRIGFKRDLTLHNIEEARYADKRQREYERKVMEGSRVEDDDRSSEKRKDNFRFTESKCKSRFMNDHIRVATFDSYSRATRSGSGRGCRGPPKVPTDWFVLPKSIYVPAYERRKYLCTVVNYTNEKYFNPKLVPAKWQGPALKKKWSFAPFLAAFAFLFRDKFVSSYGRKHMFFSPVIPKNTNDGAVARQKRILNAVRTCRAGGVVALDELLDIASIQECEYRYWPLIWAALTQNFRAFPPLYHLVEIPEFRDVMDRIFSQVAGVEDRTKFYNTYRQLSRGELPRPSQPANPTSQPPRPRQEDRPSTSSAMQPPEPIYRNDPYSYSNRPNQPHWNQQFPPDFYHRHPPQQAANNWHPQQLHLNHPDYYHRRQPQQAPSNWPPQQPPPSYYQSSSSGWNQNQGNGHRWDY